MGWRNLPSDQRGQSTVEYMLAIVAVVALGIMLTTIISEPVVVEMIREWLERLWQAINDFLAKIVSMPVYIHPPIGGL